MLASEKQLTPPEKAGRSTEHILILKKIKYYKLLFQQLQGQPVNEDFLKKTREKLNLSMHSNDTVKIHTLI